MAISLTLMGVACDKVYAQETNALHIHDSMSDNDSSFVEDPLELFLLDVQESYFDDHLMYCNDLGKIVLWGEKISPFWSHWVADNLDCIKIKSDSSIVRLYCADTLFALYEHPINLQTFSGHLYFWRFVRLFDKNDFVVPDTNIYMDYASYRRDMLINMRDQYGYKMEMLEFVIDSECLERKSYPELLLFVYDGGELRLHPVSVGKEQYLDDVYKQQLLQMAASLCSKYKAEKMIFSVPLLYPTMETLPPSFNLKKVDTFGSNTKSKNETKDTDTSGVQ